MSLSKERIAAYLLPKFRQVYELNLTRRAPKALRAPDGGYATGLPLIVFCGQITQLPGFALQCEATRHPQPPRRRAGQTRHRLLGVRAEAAAAGTRAFARFHQAA